MSSEPLPAIKHANPTKQDSIRIWEVRRKSGWPWRDGNTVIINFNDLHYSGECLETRLFFKEYGNSATGALDLWLTLFTLLLTFPRAALYQVLNCLLLATDKVMTVSQCNWSHNQVHCLVYLMTFCNKTFLMNLHSGTRSLSCCRQVITQHCETTNAHSLHSKPWRSRSSGLHHNKTQTGDKSL